MEYLFGCEANSPNFYLFTDALTNVPLFDRTEQLVQADLISFFFGIYIHSIIMINTGAMPISSEWICAPFINDRESGGE